MGTPAVGRLRIGQIAPPDYSGAFVLAGAARLRR